MGYSMSKWVAEKLVFSARERGVPISIYRPGFIMGDSCTGVTNVDDFMSRLIIGCVERGGYPDLPGQRKEFVPVDYVSDAIIYLSRQPTALGQIFHLTPPHANQSMGLVEFFEMLGSFGYRLNRQSYAEWKEALCEYVKDKEHSVLLPLVSMLTEKIYQSTLTRWELYEKMPQFHCDSTNAVLEGTSIPCRLMDRSLLATYLGFLIRRGLLPAPPTRLTLWQRRIGNSKECSGDLRPASLPDQEHGVAYAGEITGPAVPLEAHALSFLA
jgi:thioester reductase-like protein